MAKKTINDNDNDDAQIISRAKRRIADWYEYYALNNDHFRQDMKFVYEENGQWTANEITQYDEIEQRPRLTFNLLPRFLTNMAAEYASNTPDLKVRSEHFTEIEQSQVDFMTNFLRNISLDSRNDIVYQIAANNAWGGGYGAFRINIKRERPGSFNSVLEYEAIPNPLKCFWDVITVDPDKGDGQICGLAIQIHRDEFKVKYPKASIPSSTATSTYFYEDFEWFSKDTVTIAEYYEKVPIKRRYALLSDNTVVLAAEAPKTIRDKNRALKIQQQSLQGGTGGISAQLQPELDTQQLPPLPIQKVTIVKEEVHDDFDIKFYKITGTEILERKDWPGKKLPIIFQAGIAKWVAGRERTYSFVHWIRDAQRSYNYTMSEIFYRLKLTRYEPFMATQEMVSPDIKGWKNAYEAKSVLLYKAGPEGQKPERIGTQEIPQSLFATLNSVFSNLQAIPGRFEANLGASSNEVSGVAVNARKQAGNLNIKEYFDNANRAIESGARVTLDLIPQIYDTTRMINVTDARGDTKPIQINSTEQNQIKENLFNVKISVGSSFELQQQEAKETLARAYQVIPALGQIAPDIYAENLDIKNTDQLVARIRQYLIPQIAAQEGDQKAQQQLSSQHQQQQMTQQMQMLLMQLQIAKSKQELQLNQQIAQNETIKTQSTAQATQLSASANLMNAQTNRMEAVSKGVIETQKTQAEEQKAQLELTKEIIKVIGEIKQGQPDIDINSLLTQPS